MRRGPHRLTRCILNSAVQLAIAAAAPSPPSAAPPQFSLPAPGDPMKSSIRMLLVAVFLFTGAYATRCHPHRGRVAQRPRPGPGAGAGQPGQQPDGLNPASMSFRPRTRIVAWGDTSPNFPISVSISTTPTSASRQLHHPASHRAGRLGGWSPTRLHRRHDAVDSDAGILLMPISRHMLQSTANFITATR